MRKHRNRERVITQIIYFAHDSKNKVERKLANEKKNNDKSLTPLVVE